MGLDQTLNWIGEPSKSQIARVMKCMAGEIIMVFKNYLILHFRKNGVSTRRNTELLTVDIIR